METKPVPDFDGPRPGGRSHDTVHFCRHDTSSPDCVREISRVTWAGVGVNILLAVIKSVGGFAAGSSALLADAVHTLSDLATDAAVLIGVRYWSAPADAEHPHGHHKIETMVTLAIGLALAAVGLGMGYEAVMILVKSVVSGERVAVGEFTLPVLAAFGAAVASIVGKELLYRWTVVKGVELESSAVIANAWHHRSDAFSSIPPAIALGGCAIGSRLGYNLWYLDPVGTVIVCVMLLQAAWEVASPALSSLVDAGADRQLCSAIRKTILATPGVIDSHRIRTRVIGSNAVAVDLHIAVDKDLTVLEGHDIASSVKYRILQLRVEKAPRAVDVMVHVEPADPVWNRPRSGDADTLVDWKAR